MTKKELELFLDKVEKSIKENKKEFDKTYNSIIESQNRLKNLM